MVAAQAAAGPAAILDVDLLQELAPEIIFTQDLCAVCQIDSSAVARAAQKLARPAQIISLNPNRLSDLAGTVRSIASALGESPRGEELVTKLEERLEQVRSALRDRDPQRVLFVEWIDPIFCSGHWIPDQVRLAGGVDSFGRSGEKSRRLEWSDVLGYNPERIVITSCGFDLARVQQEAECLRRLPNWDDLRAVRSKNVWLTDAQLFTEPSHRLVDGVEVLAHIFHPEVWPQTVESGWSRMS